MLKSDKNRLVNLLLHWYRENERSLPWRETKDPYKIWLSEVLLQQTRVSQGLPYYLQFVKKFPSIHSLANASEGEVLRLWQGLGYYSRARNLHRCAKIVSQQLKGIFPGTAEELKKLPGIGDYTAAAIASFAFQQPTAVVDGNVFRVLSRLFGIELNIASLAGKKYFFELANELIPHSQPGQFNQAMMEFGAIHCTPKNPKCDYCIFRNRCIAFKTETQPLFPVKTKLKKRKRRYFNYLVIHAGAKTWMQLRKEKDIWEGLHQFYLLETSRVLSDQRLIELFQKTLDFDDTNISAKSTRMNQILSHQEIIGKFFILDLETTGKIILKNGKFYSNKEIDKIAKPVLINTYLKQATHG